MLAQAEPETPGQERVAHLGEAASSQQPLLIFLGEHGPVFPELPIAETEDTD